VKTSPTVAGIRSGFQNGGLQPSCMCCTRVLAILTTHEDYLVVFITVQNLTGIDAVASIVGAYACFNILQLTHENA